MTASVLVTDGEQRAALAAVRSLGRAGFEPLVCSALARPLAGASRYAAATLTVPDPLKTPEPYREQVEALLERHRIEVLLPVSEPSHIALLPAAARFARTRIAAPDLDRFLRIHDKPSVLQTAGRLGIPVPIGQTVYAPDALPSLEDWQFPVVLKPGRSVAGPGTKLTVELAVDARDLERRLAALPPGAFPALVQQRIVGPGVGVFLLRWDGEWLALFSHRRIREKPPWGGVSVYRESIAPEARLVELSRQLLGAYDWEGVAMVEYKLDAATETPYLMEVNGRLWGSLQLAIDAGVDFPALLVRAALGQRPEAVTGYRTGLRSRWWLGDLDHLIACLRWRGRPSVGGCKSRPGTIADFLKLWRPGDRSEVWRLSDPRPFFRETTAWVREAFRRG